MRRLIHPDATPRRPSGFTIVEILVVVSIFTLLLTMLLPAINSARESARRSACSANLVRIVTATSRFNAAQGFLPGSQNNLPLVAPLTGTRSTSWFAMLLPYMERNDIFKSLQQNVTPTAEVAEALCPAAISSARAIGNWLTYCVNAGTNNASFPADGAVIPNTTARRQTFDDIRRGDGLANTWLVSESTGVATGGHNEWHNWAATGAGLAGINGFRNWVVSVPVLNNFSGSCNGLPPRSRHPGGVIFGFCDGRTKFIKEDLKPHVYGHLTTSYSVWAARAVGTSGSYSGDSRPGGMHSSYTVLAVNSGTANYWLRNGSPAEPFVVKEGVDY